MAKKTPPKIKLLPKDFNRKAEAILARIQPELLPAHSDKIVSINVTTGEYVLADTLREATRKFKERWPNDFFYQVRADGGPVGRLPWACRSANSPFSVGLARFSERRTTEMGKSTLPKIPVLPRDFDRKAEQILSRIQGDLLPEQAERIVQINVDTGDYVVGDTSKDATREFRKRWPHAIAYEVRADGGPVIKFHGK